MAALIGLFVGALAGNLLWHDWGAALGGIAGFFAGVRFAAWRTRRPPGRSANAQRCRRRRPAPRRPDAGASGRRARWRGASWNWSGAWRASSAALADAAPSLRQRGRGSRRRSRNDPRPPRPRRAARHPRASLPVPADAAHRCGERAAPRDARRRNPRRDRRRQPCDAVRRRRSAGSGCGAWFTGGNALTRIGVVVLFFGVAFLLRYFAEHFTMPIELRLAAVAARRDSR